MTGPLMLNRKEWLAERRGGIGGSDIGVLMGVNNYKTPYELWLEKTGRETSEIDNRFIRLGNILEPHIAEWFQEDTGNIIIEPDKSIYVSDRSPIIRASPDYLYKDPEGKKGVLECKAIVSAGRTIQRFTDGDDSHWCQLQWYLGALGLEDGTIAYLKGGESLYFDYSFDARLFEDMAEIALDFWEKHVKADTPPPATNLGDISKMWPSHTPNKTLVADTALTDKLISYAELKDREKLLKEEMKAVETEIKLRFEDFESVTDDLGEELATFRKTADGVSLDTDRLKKELPDIYQKFLKPRPGYRMLRLKNKNIGLLQEAAL